MIPQWRAHTQAQRWVLNITATASSEHTFLCQWLGNTSVGYARDALRTVYGCVEQAGFIAEVMPIDVEALARRQAATQAARLARSPPTWWERFETPTQRHQHLEESLFAYAACQAMIAALAGSAACFIKPAQSWQRMLTLGKLLQSRFSNYEAFLDAFLSWTDTTAHAAPHRRRCEQERKHVAGRLNELPWDTDLEGDRCLVPQHLMCLRMSFLHGCYRCATWTPLEAESLLGARSPSTCSECSLQTTDPYAQVLNQLVIRQYHTEAGARSIANIAPKQRVTFARGQRVSCSWCEEVLVDTPAQLLSRGSGKITCPTCRGEHRFGRPGAWLWNEVPALEVAVVPTQPPPTETPRIFATCGACTAPQILDGTSRHIVCANCTATTVLDDGTWHLLHPKPRAPKVQFLLPAASCESTTLRDDPLLIGGLGIVRTSMPDRALKHAYTPLLTPRRSAQQAWLVAFGAMDALAIDADPLRLGMLPRLPQYVAQLAPIADRHQLTSHTAWRQLFASGTRYATQPAVELRYLLLLGRLGLAMGWHDEAALWARLLPYVATLEQTYQDWTQVAQAMRAHPMRREHPRMLSQGLLAAQPYWQRVGWRGSNIGVVRPLAESVELHGFLECSRCGSAMPIVRWGASPLRCPGCHTQQALTADPAVALEGALFHVRRSPIVDAWYRTSNATFDGIYHWELRRGPVTCIRCQSEIMGGTTAGYTCSACGKPEVINPAAPAPRIDPGIVGALSKASVLASGTTVEVRCHHCGAGLPYDGHHRHVACPTCQGTSLVEDKVLRKLSGGYAPSQWILLFDMCLPAPKEDLAEHAILISGGLP